jgi:hypothetical protein
VNAAGQQMYATAWTGTSLVANSATSYTADWKITASVTPGSYTFQITISASNGTLLGSDALAGQFTVQ